MEDIGIAPNMYIQLFKWVWAESGVCTYAILEYHVLAWLSAYRYWLEQLYVFGAISSSSILRAHLYTTYSSMLGTYSVCPILPVFPALVSYNDDLAHAWPSVSLLFCGWEYIEGALHCCVMDLPSLQGLHLGKLPPLIGIQQQQQQKEMYRSNLQQKQEQHMSSTKRKQEECLRWAGKEHKGSKRNGYR